MKKFFKYILFALMALFYANMYSNTDTELLQSITNIKTDSRKLQTELTAVPIANPEIKEAWNAILKNIKDAIHKTRTDAENLYHEEYTKHIGAGGKLQQLRFVLTQTELHYQMVNELIEIERTIKESLDDISKKITSMDQRYKTKLEELKNEPPEPIEEQTSEEAAPVAQESPTEK